MVTGNANPAAWTLDRHNTGTSMNARTAAAGAGAVIAMVVLATALGGGAHATMPVLGGAGHTSIASTAPLTLATSVATPTVTATPYGSEGP